MKNPLSSTVSDSFSSSRTISASSPAAVAVHHSILFSRGGEASSGNIEMLGNGNINNNNKSFDDRVEARELEGKEEKDQGGEGGEEVEEEDENQNLLKKPSPQSSLANSLPLSPSLLLSLAAYSNQQLSPTHHQIIQQQHQPHQHQHQPIYQLSHISSTQSSSSSSSAVTASSSSSSVNTNANPNTSSILLPSSYSSSAGSLPIKESRFSPSSWFHRRIVGPFYELLKSGATPDGIALSLAFGSVGGVFPVPTITTLACIFLSYLFKLNFPAVQIANLLMSPINFATFIPFIRAGESLLGVEATDLSISSFQQDPVNAIRNSWVALLRGILAWCVFLPPATIILYFSIRPIIRHLMASIKFT